MAFERDDYNRDRNRGGGYGDRDRSSYGPQGYRGQSDRSNRDHDNSDDRGFFDRAGDEVRSWFGDDDAERRRERDDQDYDRNSQRAQQRNYGRGGTGYGGSSTYDQTRREFSPSQQHHDPHYADWRQRQIDALDRDYDEYRRTNQSKFENEFGGWRTQRQGQRSLLDQVEEHQEVVGSDGQHIGTVDKVKGDRIVLTKNDPNAGGHHHSIPSLWLKSVEDGKIAINKTADEAKRAWRDEDRNSAMFGDDQRDKDGPHILNRSFSGTY